MGGTTPARPSNGLSDPTPSRIRLGVVGLGAVAQAVHLPLIAKVPGIELAAICDLSRTTRDAIGERYGIPAGRRFEHAEDLLAADGLDAVAILTSGSHGALATSAARAGLAVFCEKPLAYTLAEIDELAAESPRLMLGYMKLYDPAVERARALLADRPAPRSVEVTVLHPPSAPQLAHAGLLPAPDDIDPDALERVLAEADAATVAAVGAIPAELAHAYAEVLLGSLVHDLAVVRGLVGGPLEFEYGDAWPTGTALSVAFLGRLRGGARVSLRWHYLESYPAYREEVRVHDDLGSVELTFPAPYLLHAPTVLTVTGAEDDAERVTSFRSTAEAFERQWIAFDAFVRDGRPPYAGLAEGRADIVACQAAARVLAARKGVTVGGEAAHVAAAPALAEEAAA